MSRIGKKPIAIPAGVDVKIDGNVVTVKGGNVTLEQSFRPEIKIEVENGEIIVSRPDDTKEMRSLHGLTRALIHNMVVGVTEGFQKTLEINGTGYRATMQGKNLLLYLGHSLVNGMPQAALTVAQPEGITFEVNEKAAPITIVVKGADKQLVGQTAAVIRGKRPPEPYHGKGIRYAGEKVRRKAGKTGK